MILVEGGELSSRREPEPIRVTELQGEAEIGRADAERAAILLAVQPLSLIIPASRARRSMLDSSYAAAPTPAGFRTQVAFWVGLDISIIFVGLLGPCDQVTIRQAVQCARYFPRPAVGLRRRELETKGPRLAPGPRYFRQPWAVGVPAASC